MKPFIIGTAGHIDHGKSSIVKALTGTNPDRFEEELQRGMTIDIGFAFLTDKIAIIDVPGHERFIKNMVAGVSTVDALMLVVAADDSVMPQTREHLHIAQILGIETGFIVLNKIDVMSEDWLPLVEDEIRETLKGTFLQDAPIIRCSAKTGEGIEEIRKMIFALEEELKAPQDREFFRLPIDRVFTLRGIGTVVTGSVLSGELKSGDTIIIYPSARKTRVRGIHSQGKSFSRVSRGQRAAVNLQGVEKSEIIRGNELANSDILNVSDRFMVSLKLFDFSKFPLKHGHRVRFHLGTGEYIGRTYLLDAEKKTPGEECFGQIVLEEKIASGFKDRFLIRHYSPPLLLGGGQVLGFHGLKLRKKMPGFKDALNDLLTGDLINAFESFINFNRKIVSLNSLSTQFTLTQDEIENILKGNNRFKIFTEKRQKFVCTLHLFEKLSEKLSQTLEKYHSEHPREPGMDEFALMKSLNADTLTFSFLKENLLNRGKINQTGNRISLSGFQVKISEEEQKLILKVKALLPETTFKPESLGVLQKKLDSDRELKEWMIKYLINSGEWVLLPGEVVVPAAALKWAEERIVKMLRKHGSATVSEIKDELQTTRRNLIEVLNYFDSSGVTERIDDKRILGKNYR